MAKNMQPIAKRCKALGISPAVMGYAKKETNRNPGGQMRKKKSEYGIQLNEKQKVKFIYGILEKQFHAYYEAAAKTPGKTGDNLLIAVERRLDNVVYRMGFAMTRRQARQLVSHAHFTVNGRKVDIPSYQVKAGDVIEVAESSRSSEIFKRLLGQDAPVFLIPAWMEREKNALKGTVTRLPAREDIEAKKQIILRHGLALWDTLESCTITGASDASIRDVVPNDIAGLLAKAPIEAVFCNGATAYKIYTKYLEPVSGIPAVRLPSTSPANAACRPEKLREIWQKELSNWILP